MGAATRARAHPPDALLRTDAGLTIEPTEATHHGQPSRRALALAGIERHTVSFCGHGPRAFRSGTPAVDIFPVDIWGRLMARRWQRTPAKALGYGDAFGFRPLREAITEYLGAARGVRCTADQVMIVPGSQLGLDIAFRTLLDPGDEAWLEDPGYHGARGALTAAGARIVRCRLTLKASPSTSGASLRPRRGRVRHAVSPVPAERHDVRGATARARPVGSRSQRLDHRR